MLTVILKFTLGDGLNQPVGSFQIHSDVQLVKSDEFRFPQVGDERKMVVVDVAMNARRKRLFDETFLASERPIVIFKNPQGKPIEAEVSAERKVRGEGLQLVVLMSQNDASLLRVEELIKAPVIFYTNSQATVKL